MIIFNIKNIRKKKGITLYKLEKITGISRAYLYKLENNIKLNPTLAVLYSIADGLDVNIKDLFFSKFDIENLRPTYRLLIGIPGKSNAFAISRKLGLDEKIINRASSMIDKETINLEDLLKNIYDSKSKIEDEKIRTSLALQEAEELRNSLKHQHSNVSNKEKELIANAKQEAKQILIDAKETANSIIKDMNSATSASKANKLRNALNEKISSINTNAEDVELSNNLLPAIAREEIKPGLNVYVSNLKTNGVIVSNISKDETVQVQVGIMKMKVDIKNLQETATSLKASVSASSIKSTKSSQSTKSEKNKFANYKCSMLIYIYKMNKDINLPCIVRVDWNFRTNKH